MRERLLLGLPASPGEAFGRARVLGVAVDPSAPPLAPALRDAALAAARAALAAAGDELAALASRLRDAGRESEAEIVETGVLMAADPALDAALSAAVIDDARDARAALLAACEVHAAAIAALPDPTLAARADDVRSLGRRAARRVTTPAGAASAHADALAGPDALAGADVADGPDVLAGPDALAGPDVIVIADDLGPADVAELDEAVAGIALAAGAPSAHAAVVARGLGIPMAVGLGADVVRLLDGEPVALDGGAGTVAVAPSPARARAARRAQELRAADRAGSLAAAALPAVTTDGHRITVLVNAATAAEVEAGLAAGAEGVGLLRTELAFLDAAAWPDEAAHRAALEPVLARLEARTATVRVLDFGADKTPPFLRGTPERGLALMLGHLEQLEAQLRAIVAAGGATRLRVLLPLVEAPAQVATVRRRLPRGVAIGAMIETRAAVAAAREIAHAADFLSIGTNDLTADVLESDRFGVQIAARPDRPGAGAAATHDPRVLAAIAATTTAARAAGRVVEVCGEAASEPVMVRLLIGLGVEELSVGAVRVGATRAAVRGLDANAARALAELALRAADADAVAALVREACDAAGQRLDGRRPVVAVGEQP